MNKQLYEDQYVNVGGIKTRFWKAGDRGKVVVLVHGLFSSIEFWLSNLPALAGNHRVYALDMPGFGLTDKIPLNSLSHGAQFIDDFMKTQNINRASLVGHSMGGGFSLQYAIQYPNRVDSLVLIDGFGLGRKMHYLFRLLSIPVIGELFTRPSRNGIRKSQSMVVYDPSVITDEFVDTAYRLALLPGAQKSLLSVVRKGGSIFGIHPEFIRSITDNLHTVKTPTLLIWGEQDRLLPVEQGHAARDKMPDARLEIFENCGHLPHIEHPDKFNSLVLKFLAE